MTLGLKRYVAVALCAGVLWCAAEPAMGSVPAVNHFSAVMKVDNVALEDEHDVIVRLLDEADETVWTQSFTDVAFDDGFFTIEIGKDATTALSDTVVDAAESVQIEVQGETLLLDFSSSFYSFVASKAYSADTATTANVALTANTALTASVAQSVAWEDITGAPEMTTGSSTVSWDSVTGKPTLVDEDDVLLKSDNLSSVTSVSTARSNLGVAIGSDVQAYDSNLDLLSGVTTSNMATTILGAATTGDVLKWDGSKWAPASDDTGATSWVDWSGDEDFGFSGGISTAGVYAKYKVLDGNTVYFKAKFTVASAISAVGVSVPDGYDPIDEGVFTTKVVATGGSPGTYTMTSSYDSGSGKFVTSDNLSGLTGVTVWIDGFYEY